MAISVEEFSSIANFFSEAALLIAKDGTILAANRQIRRFSYAPEEIQGWSFEQILSSSSEDIVSFLRSCSRNREAVPGRLTVVTKGGEQIACRCSGAVIHHDPTGEQTQLLIKFVPQAESTPQFSILNQKVAQLSEEIRRRQQLQGELVAQRESLRVTLTSIGDGVIVCDVEGRITFLNPIAEELTGWNQEETEGRLLTEVFNIVNETTRERVENPAHRALAEGTVVGLANHTVLVAKDGSERPIDDSAAPIIDHDGGIAGVVLVFRDATEKRQAEIEHGRLAALVDSSEDAIIGMDFEGIITNWNIGAEQLFGYTAEEAVGSSMFETIAPTSRREELRQTLLRIQKGERPVPLETIRQHRDGRQMAVSIRYSPIRDKAGETIGVSAIDRDISSLKAAQKRRNVRLAVSQIVSQEPDVETAISRILAAVCSILRWDAGCFWQFDTQEDVLVCPMPWQQTGGTERFREATRELAFKRGEGLPGKVWDKEAPVWITDVQKDGSIPRSRNGKFHGAFGCPVVLGNEFIGVIEWFSEQVQEADDELLEMMRTIGGQIGQFIERREAERRLRQSEQELTDFFENAAVGLHWVGPDGIVLRANRAELKMLGYRLDEYVGHHIAEFHVDQDVIESILTCLAEGGEVKDHEARLRCKDGSIKHVLIDSNVMWQDGEFVHTRCFTRDITQRRHAESALQDSEERLRIALEAGRMGTWEWRIREGEVIWSPTLEQIHGIPVGSFPGTFEAYQQDIHPEDRERVLSTIRNSIEAGQEHFLEYRIIWPDRSVHWLEARGRLIRDDEGQPLRLIGVCSDITFRKQLEESLRLLADASKLLSEFSDFESTLQEMASLAVSEFADWCVVDTLLADGSLKLMTLTHVDPAKTEIVRQLRLRFPLTFDETFGVSKVLETGQSQLVSEIDDGVLQAAAQNEVHLQMMRDLGVRSCMFVPLVAKHQLLGVLTFVSGDTGRRYSPEDLALAEELASRTAIALENAQLYEELREADRRKDEFLAMLAHELRNPLAPIRSGLDLLAMNPREDHETIALMQDQVEHVVRLVDDLLDVSRIMRGRVEIRREVVELGDLIRRSVLAVQPMIKGQNQELEVAFREHGLWLDVDPIRIVQVFENLLNNASKYTDSEGTINLIAERVADEAVISIKDNGVGIEPELLPHVFDLFTQSSRSLDRSQGGLGIGLTLVKQLVEMHGGNVTAESKGSGYGSTFTVRLPLAKSAVPRQEKEIGKLPAKNFRMLVVDDNRGAAILLARLLVKLGEFEIEIAHDGSTTLAKVNEFRPDVVFLDIGLPGMDGHEVASNIRKDKSFDSMLLIALTGYGQEEDKRKSAEVGCDLHLVKPPSIDQLREALTHKKIAGK